MQKQKCKRRQKKRKGISPKDQHFLSSQETSLQKCKGNLFTRTEKEGQLQKFQIQDKSAYKFMVSDFIAGWQFSVLFSNHFSQLSISGFQPRLHIRIIWRALENTTAQTPSSDILIVLVRVQHREWNFLKGPQVILIGS